MTSFFIFLIVSLCASSAIAVPLAINEHWAFIFLYIALIPAFYLVMCCIWMTMLFIISLCVNEKKEHKKCNKFVYWLIYQTVWQLRLLGRILIKKKNFDLMPKNENYLYICNHTSFIDPLISINLSRNQPLICITKPENFKVFIFGKLVQACGYIAIDREDNFKAIKSITRATQVVKNKEGSIFICPEGTRSKTGEVGEFHAGSFKIAEKSKCPIVVMSFKGCKAISKNLVRPTISPVEAEVVKVLYYDDYKDMKTQEIAEYTRNLIVENLNSKK